MGFELIICIVVFYFGVTVFSHCDDANITLAEAFLWPLKAYYSLKNTWKDIVTRGRK